MTTLEIYKDDLKSIIVTVESVRGIRKQVLTYREFKRSFIDERWSGERRYGKTCTIFGYCHTKTVTTNPHSNEKTIRTFDFPSNLEKAQQIHEQYEEEMQCK